MEQGSTITAHEYYDHTGNRSALTMFYKGELHTVIFNYKDDQLLYIRGR